MTEESDAELIARIQHLLTQALTASWELEQTFTFVLARVLDTNLTKATIIAGNTGIGRIEGLMRELLEHGQASGDLEALRAWLPRAKEAITARNRLIHRAWLGSGREPDQMLTKMLTLEPRSADDVRRDIETIQRAVFGAPR